MHILKLIALAILVIAGLSLAISLIISITFGLIKLIALVFVIFIGYRLYIAVREELRK
jgi:hypothetical protein